jgi:hypothetical protein
MVLGGTAAGKTTALNALTCLIRPGSKIITIEETAELNLPHENWVSLIARQSYGLSGSSVGEVTLFDLVKTSMRHRPDVLIVGEVRGSEAYVLFQALATGHGGMCTMHAENLDSAIKRLTSKPMDISSSYIPLMNIILSVLLAFTQLSVDRAASRAVADIVPVSRLGLSLGLSSPSDQAQPGLDADSGFTWNLQATFPNVVFIDLSFADDSVGYACAELGIVYKTTNSGATCTRIMDLGFPYYWYGVSALSRERAIVSGFDNAY